MSIGLDSISATELAMRLSERLDLELPPTLLFDHPSLRSIAGTAMRDGVATSIRGPGPCFEATSTPFVQPSVDDRR